jgi:hypothetical protein
MQTEQFLEAFMRLNRVTQHNLRFVLESYCEELTVLLQEYKPSDEDVQTSLWQLQKEARNILTTLQTIHKEPSS